MMTPEEYRESLIKRKGLHSYRWVEKQCEAYERAYNAEKRAEAEARAEEYRYINSELVQKAGKILAQFFFYEVIWKAPHSSSKEQISCRLRVEVDGNKIVYYDPAHELSSSIGMRMLEKDPGLWRELNARFYTEHYHQIAYTGSGWNFESITDPDILKKVTSAIAKLLMAYVQQGINESDKYFPQDRNGSVSMSDIAGTDTCVVVVTYTAENANYAPVN